MLNPIFKRLKLISFFIGGELRVAIVAKYDKKIIVSYALEVLSPFVATTSTKSSFTVTFDENNNLDIFEMVVGTNESITNDIS